MLTVVQQTINRQYARDITAIQPRWLPELAPAFFASKAAAAGGGAVGREVGGANGAS